MDKSLRVSLARRQRRATSYPEVLVSAVLLVTTMSLVTTTSFRIGRLWKDIRHQHLALDELSNQLERLTGLSVDAAKDQVVSLQPSEAVQRSLDSANLNGEITHDPRIGHRVTLQINWRRHHGGIGKPLELTAWWPSADLNSASENPQEPE